MNSKKYFSRYYKGENEPPQNLSQRGKFFWDYERSFYATNRNPSKEEFEEWLNDFLCNYLPYKMMSGPLQNEEEVIAEWKREYENS